MNGQFIQIMSHDGHLYALDNCGAVWQLRGTHWHRITKEREKA